MSWLSNFMHPEKGYQKGQEQLDKYYKEAQGYLNPYNQHGEQSFQQLFGAFQNLLNPTELQNQWSSNYQESPYAKQLEGIASERGLNAAQSLGLNGSNTALGAIQQGTSQIVNQDRQQYMDNLMQKYLAGLGVGQNFYNQGANAAGKQSENANNMGQNSANMSFGQQNSQGSLFGNLLGTGGAIAGGILGGPIGGALGAGLGQYIGASPKGSYNPSPWSSTGGR